MSVDFEDMIRRVRTGEGEAEVVRIIADKLEEAGHTTFTCWVLSDWADHTPCGDVAWAYKRVADIYLRLGNKGMSNLAMRKARLLMLRLVSVQA